MKRRITMKKAMFSQLQCLVNYGGKYIMHTVRKIEKHGVSDNGLCNMTEKDRNE